jgi:REP element-mobilizing transposase RayT
MARRPRIHVPGGFYHATLRGNHQQPIFLADGHPDLLGRIVADAATEEHARIHAFCWMSNHIHLLVQVCARPLGWFMMRIASRYARTVQSRMKTTGHFFERRYHATLIDVDRYLLAVVRYIHLNPVKAGLVRDPTAYVWSSHRVYLGRAECAWLTTDFVLRALAHQADAARRQYRLLMNDAAPDTDEISSLLEAGRSSRLPGNDAFAAQVAAGSRLPPPRERLDAILAECVARFGIPLKLLASPSKARRLSAARAWLAHRVVAGRAASICAVARLLDRSEGSIRQLMSSHPPDPDAI